MNIFVVSDKRPEDILLDNIKLPEIVKDAEGELIATPFSNLFDKSNFDFAFGKLKLEADAIIVDVDYIQRLRLICTQDPTKLDDEFRKLAAVLFSVGVTAGRRFPQEKKAASAGQTSKILVNVVAIDPGQSNRAAYPEMLDWLRDKDNRRTKIPVTSRDDLYTFLRFVLMRLDSEKTDKKFNVKMGREE